MSPGPSHRHSPRARTCHLGADRPTLPYLGGRRVSPTLQKIPVPSGCFLPGQPPALSNPCWSLQERGVSLRPFLLLIKSWIRPDFSPGSSWSFKDQRGWYQKAQGPAWLGQRQAAWQVVTGLLAGFQAVFSWALAVLWGETSHAGYETLPTGKGRRVSRWGTRVSRNGDSGTRK